jgi:hypothetical protein
MTGQLESELRATLRERAAQVPAASTARLTHVDYHPRTRGLRPPLAIGVLAGAASAAGAVVALVSLGAGASNAFAGWTPAPTLPSPAQLAAARVDCKARSPIARLPLKLVDARGPFTFSVYADSNSSATCISGPSFTAVSGSMSSAPANVPAGRVLLSSSHLTNRDGQAYSFAVGHTGAGVSAVMLVLDAGTKVRATVANEWFVAWWPSAHEVKAADITTPAGVKTQTFDLRHESPCGAKLCTGGGIGLNSSGPVSRQAGGSTSTSSIGSATGHGGGVEGFSVSR